MIESIHIKNFKSLNRVDLKLGPLNIFIGSNASGKSNFFDALRVLQGIGYGFTFSEILDGKPKSASSEVWEGIRGGSGMAAFEGAESDKVELELTLNAYSDRPKGRMDFRIAFLARSARLVEERLSTKTRGPIYDSSPITQVTPGPVFGVRYYRGEQARPPHHSFEPSRSVLAQFARGEGKNVKKTDAAIAAKILDLLANMQRLDPSPSKLKDYSQAHQISRMGERGENFAALVRTICADEKRKSSFLSWLRQLRPAELDDVGTLKGAVGEPLFMLREGGHEFPAPILSDGTLRFAAITAAFFQPDMPAILTIEEIENGIHASRLRLLVELLRNRAANGNTQVMVTTHSPIILAWLKEEEYAHTFFCRRDEESGESKICPLTEVPHFMETVKKQPISDLFAEGWLEAAL